MFWDSLWVGEPGPLPTGGLTPYLLWQKGQVVHLLLIHLPGGVEYKTNTHTFTVSTGTQRRGWGDPGKPWASVLGTSLPCCSLLPSPAPLSRPCPHVQVAAEVLEEMCGQMGITDPHEVQEFALFLIKGEGRPPGLGRKRGPAGLRDMALPAKSALLATGEAAPTLGLAGSWAGLAPGGRAGCGPRLPAQASWCGPCGPGSTSTARWWVWT